MNRSSHGNACMHSVVHKASVVVENCMRNAIGHQEVVQHFAVAGGPGWAGALSRAIIRRSIS